MKDKPLINLGERVPVPGEESAARPPYFEVLVVSPAHRTVWQELAQDFRRLRRPVDKFIYEPVFVSALMRTRSWRPF